MRRAIPAVVAALLLSGAALADPATSAEVFPWTDPARADFGGFSGLVMDPDGAGLVAVSDRGGIWTAKVTRDATGRIASVTTTAVVTPLDSKGQPQTEFLSDAEALTIAPGGRLMVGYEGLTRVAGYDLPDPLPRATDRWDRFRALWGNEAIEGLATLPDGRLLAVIETADADGAYPTYLLGPQGWQEGPAIPGADGYAAAGADVGPDGRLYLLERWYRPMLGFATRVRVFSGRPEAFGRGATILETPAGTLDNMEGLSVWRRRDGALVATMVSDDNFSLFQKTELAEFTIPATPP